MIDIETIDRNYVVIARARLDRPARVSPGRWLEFWEERIEVLSEGDLEAARSGGYDDGYRDGYRDGERTMG